jgi:hypothetical protein
MRESPLFKRIAGMQYSLKRCWKPVGFIARYLMTHRAWMADAERLMNLMERFDYKSEQYNVCRQILLSHLAKKPKQDEDVTAWTMTGPAPFDFDDLAPPPLPPAPAPEVEATIAMTPEPAPIVKTKKRSTAKKKAVPSGETEVQKLPIEKPKRVRKRTTTVKAAPPSL